MMNPKTLGSCSSHPSVNTAETLNSSVRIRVRDYHIAFKISLTTNAPFLGKLERNAICGVAFITTRDMQMANSCNQSPYEDCIDDYENNMLSHGNVARFEKSGIYERSGWTGSSSGS